MSQMRRYLQVGLGGRGKYFTNALLKEHCAHGQLVALCDANPGRLELSRKNVLEVSGQNPVCGGPDDFARLVEQTKPDAVIVTCMDSAHDRYIVGALELGCDVITEKPMTIDAVRCRRILDAVARTQRRVRVTFNYRYSPPRTQVKKMLMDGAVGKIISVDFQWLLDLNHGADYFRRWHRQKANSGSLLVHKATHHFDLVNWWLSSSPETVAALGRRCFYVPEQGDAFGLQERGVRCSDCKVSGKCKFFLDLGASAGLRTMYREQEHHDGYYRDRCVFNPDMDIYDSMNVVVGYKSGVGLTYSLNAFMPWEGYLVTFNGTRGRLVHACQESSYISGREQVQGGTKVSGTYIELQPIHAAGGQRFPLWKGVGGHGGGDAPLMADLFAPNSEPDPYCRAADQRAGAASILVGAAALKSIEEKRMVRIDELVPDLQEPDWPYMPTERLPDFQWSDSNK